MQCKPTGKDQQKTKYGYRELSQSPLLHAAGLLTVFFFTIWYQLSPVVSRISGSL